VECGEEEDDQFLQRWSALIELPSQNAQLPVPGLVSLKSPYRFVVAPVMEYILKLQSENPTRHIAVLVPELIENHWYNFLLHNNRSKLLKALLDRKENTRITVINIPWYLSPSDKNPQP
jgi:hypothetical protein